LVGVTAGAVSPQEGASFTVAYGRGGLMEQYLARQSSLEQRFIIPRPVLLGGADLVIAGAVGCEGAFEATEDGWLWRSAEGAVRLGDVRAYDATGQDLAATMHVTAAATRIVVDGSALAQAAYPVTIDPEIGANDFRLSDMGGDHLFDAYVPAVAYNSTDNEYLVVWRGDDDNPPLVDDEFEIYGQRVDAATGAKIDTDFRVSDMGPDGDTDYGAFTPAVAYNSTDNQYLVVWRGDDDTWPFADEEFEIYGQRVEADTGAEIGGDFRVSTMGAVGDANYDAFAPAVAYNSTDNEYLVVWHSDDNTPPLVDDENEVYGQRLDAATGAPVGDDDFRLSDMGPDGSGLYDAWDPAVAYNSTDNEYVVVWAGDDDTPPVDGEDEIYGQRLDAATGDEIGDNDFRLSDMGPDGDTDFGAYRPAVAYNSTDNQYLVVWEGIDNTTPLMEEESEVYGQRLNAVTGAEIGDNDFRLSDMGPDGDVYYGAFRPAVAYSSTSNEYLVVWAGSDDTSPLVSGETEIFGQRVEAVTGAQIGDNDFRLSDMGPDGDMRYDAFDPAVAHNSTDNQYLVVWYGDDDTPPLVDDEFEIFGQRLNAARGTEIGADARLSDMAPRSDCCDAWDPAVAYNSTDNQYLVVWSGSDDIPPLVQGENEIFGQRVDAATGAQIGDNDFRLSDMGSDGDTSFDAHSPAVAYNSADNEYLVVWRGEDNIPPLVEGEYEIFGQRLDAATGAEIGDNDFRLTDMGPNGNTGFGVYAPAVAYNSTDNEYLVVWSGDDNTPPLVQGEFEIYGQRLDAATGAEIGVDLRLSNMGPDGSGLYNAWDPAVAYNSTDNQYLVVWSGDDNTPPLVQGETEIFGQRVEAATGAEIGVDLRLSDVGPDGDTAYDASTPAVAYNSTDNQYLVVWRSCADELLPACEPEILGQRVEASTGAEIGVDFRLSDMGPDGSEYDDALAPAVAYSCINNEYLVVWHGDQVVPPLVDDELEIYGQRVEAATGAEIGANDFRLSDMGSDGNEYDDASYPAVAYNRTNGEYLVVWRGNEGSTVPLIDPQFEIYGQRFAAVCRVFLPLVVRQH
jgi:hypothetical protein